MAQDVDVFARYFALFWSIIDEYDIYPADIHNMDEKGFMQGGIAKQRVIVSRDEAFQGKSFITQCGNREWTTVIDYIGTRLGRPQMAYTGSAIFLQTISLTLASCAGDTMRIRTAIPASAANTSMIMRDPSCRICVWREDSQM